MAEFENPYAKHDPFVRAHFNCPSCDGKLWEYAIQRIMFCEECGASFRTSEVFESLMREPKEA